jgi:uncharacterized protein with HEPN domain
MPRSDEALLRDMLDAAMEIQSLSKGRRRRDLNSNRMLSLSLVRLLEIIGEAAANVTRGFRSDHMEIPWGVIIGMRNRLVHAYTDVSLDVVWSTVKEDLPPLVKALESVLGQKTR